MIIGIGNDLCDIRRIEQSVERFGDRFLNRVFTDVERAKSARRKLAPKAYFGTLAKRFAAKEACAKALGTGFSQGVYMRDLGVVNLASGQPTLCLTGGAAHRLQELTPPGMRAVVHLTMTDEWPTAEAIVMISAVPLGAVGSDRAG